MAATARLALVVVTLTAAAASAAEPPPPSGNRFVDAGPVRLDDVTFGTDATTFAPLAACEHELSIAWTAQLGSAAYAPPVVSRLPSEPSVRVSAATFSRYVEALRGADGHELPGWPHEADGSLFHAPPLPVDLDGDGVDELVLVSYDGEVSFVRQGSSMPLFARASAPVNVDANLPAGPGGAPGVGGGGREPLALRVPRLRVRREWLAEHAARRAVGAAAHAVHDAAHGAAGLAGDEAEAEAEAEAEEEADEEAAERAARGDDARASLRARAAAERGGGGGAARVPIGPFAGLTADAVRSLELFADEDDDARADDDEDGGGGGGGLDGGGWAAAEAREAAAAARAARAARARTDGAHVLVDAHVLAPATIADLDGDGLAEELVLAVSYFYDDAQAAELHAQLPHASSAHHLAAAGVVAFRLPQPVRGAAGGASRLFAPHRATGAAPLWSAHLHLALASADADSDTRAPHVYGAPTVVDVDGDGASEVAVATCAGFVYLLDARTGRMRDGWPVRLAEVQGHVAAADVAGDDALELIVADAHGHLVVLDAHGREVWVARIAGLAARGVAVGDVNGDGQLDIIAATSASSLHALDGASGLELTGFPVRLAGRVMALPLLIRLARARVGGGGGGGGVAARARAAGVRGDGDAALATYIIFSAFDGAVYFVSGESGCTAKLDIGEHSYAQIVPASLHGAAAPARVDLLVATMGGSLLAIETATAAHPLRVRGGASAAGLGRPGALLEGGFGAYFAPAAGGAGGGGFGGGGGTRDVTGATFDVPIVIVDGPRRRPPPAGAPTAVGAVTARYAVTLTLGGVTVRAFNTTRAGEHMVRDLRSLGARSRGALRLRVTDAHAQVAEDTIVLAFNAHFYRALKWLAAAPALAIGVVALLSAKARPPSVADAALPGL